MVAEPEKSINYLVGDFVENKENLVVDKLGWLICLCLGKFRVALNGACMTKPYPSGFCK